MNTNPYAQIVEGAKQTREALAPQIEAAKKALDELKAEDKEMAKLIAKYAPPEPVPVYPIASGFPN